MNGATLTLKQPTEATAEDHPLKFLVAPGQYDACVMYRDGVPQSEGK